MLSDLFEDFADVPPPPPNQWDPSHKSVLPSSFSRTPGILWLQKGPGINYIIDQLWYVIDSVINNHVTAEGHSLWAQCRTKLHIMFNILSETLAAVTCMAHYGNWLQPSVHRLIRFCREVQPKWLQQIGFTCTMFHPQIVSLSGEIHFMLKDFKSKAFCGQNSVWRHYFLCVSLYCDLSCTQHQKCCP